MYSQTTHDIRITVDPVYLDDHSEPIDDQYVWAYEVRIENTSDQTVTLRNRHWKITDARGRVEEFQALVFRASSQHWRLVKPLLIQAVHRSQPPQAL